MDAALLSVHVFVMGSRAIVALIPDLASCPTGLGQEV